MFIKFHSSDDSSFTPEAINLVVQAVEHVMKRFDVMKVKTIGSTIILVAGIDDPRTRQEQLSGVVDAAIMVRAYAMPTLDINDLTYRIGIHCGPCFGAVIGGNGAVFDFFGDTVNTASRVCTTAPVNGIQLSAAAYGLLLPRLINCVRSQESVVMKGKGRVEVYHLDSTIDPQQLPDFVSRDFSLIHTSENTAPLPSSSSYSPLTTHVTTNSSSQI